MAESTTWRIFVPDVRGNDQYLRATWHPETEVVVVSHWVGEVCAASTPVGVSELSTLISLLVTALQDAATRPQVATATAPTGEAADAGGLAGQLATAGLRWPLAVVDRLRHLLRPKWAEIIPLRCPPARGETKAASRD